MNKVKPNQFNLFGSDTLGLFAEQLREQDAAADKTKRDEQVQEAMIILNATNNWQAGELSKAKATLFY